MGSDKGIWVEGERELYANMQRVMSGNLAAARKGLQAAGLDIIADAKDNLRNNTSVVTGLLRASGKVQKVQGDDDAIDVGFFSSRSKGYAFFVEYGRRAGKMPPPDELVQYARKKFGLAAEHARQVGWAMARKIAKHGTRPHPFFAPAVQKNEKKVADAIAKAIKEDIK